MNIRLSIIIPVYNVESYLKECLDSIIKQNNISIEIICVNDGSTDKSLSILRSYENDIIIIDQENAGLSAARNTGIKRATGEYLFFLDSDDYVSDSVIKNILIQLNYDYDLIELPFQRVDEKGDLWHVEQLFEGDLMSNKKAILSFSPSAWNKIIKRDILVKNNITFAHGLKYEDIHYTLRILPLCSKIKCLDYVCINYRFNPNSIMQNSKILDDFFVTLDDLIPKIDLNYIDEIEYVIFKHLILGHLSRVALGLNIEETWYQLHKTYNYLKFNFNNYKKNLYFKKNIEKSFSIKFLIVLGKTSKYLFFIVLMFYKFYSLFSRKIKRW